MAGLWGYSGGIIQRQFASEAAPAAVPVFCWPCSNPPYLGNAQTVLRARPAAPHWYLPRTGRSETVQVQGSPTAGERRGLSPPSPPFRFFPYGETFGASAPEAGGADFAC
jgi:hypothetical protein